MHITFLSWKSLLYVYAPAAHSTSDFVIKTFFFYRKLKGFICIHIYVHINTVYKKNAVDNKNLLIITLRWIGSFSLKLYVFLPSTHCFFFFGVLRSFAKCKGLFFFIAAITPSKNNDVGIYDVYIFCIFDDDIPALFPHKKKSHTRTLEIFAHFSFFNGAERERKHRPAPHRASLLHFGKI